MRLSDETLADLPDTIRKPTYDRSRLKPGIVHIGLGNFHRAHQSWYLHRLFEQGLNHDWAIVGAGVRPYDSVMRDKLKSQDYLTTLIELTPTDTSAEIIGSMIDYVPIVEGNGPLIERMADPSTRIVSLTVTEGGYFVDPSTKGFDESHPDIKYDAANPDRPKTAFGAMVAALRLRRDRGAGPFTGQSCDNLQGNGAILRQTIVSLARLSDPELAIWIDKNCSFPNSMVDCIVPATGAKEIALCAGYGVDDAAPVTHEQFRQWVIEDDFCAGRPDWEKVGATFSGNVHGYEAQKIRILNAGHQIIANIGDLLHIETIAETMQNRVIHGLFRKVELEEIAPHVVPVPGMTPQQYVDLIEGRFANPAIVDTTRRVAFDGSSRHPGFLLPTVRDALAAGGSVQGLALVEALWARMATGIREDGTQIEPNDPFWDKITVTARRAKESPSLWLEMRGVYGDLADEPRFAAAFEGWLKRLHSDGAEATVTAYLGGSTAD